MAVVIVLGVISIAIALSYSLIRTQSMTLRIEHNSGLRRDAEAAARAGMAVALRRMHESGWTIDSVYSGSLGGGATYSASYVTGDASITEFSSQQEKNNWAYRVTVNVVGTATDPGSGLMSEAKISSVVRLVPENMPSEPPSWAQMQEYIVYQTKNRTFQLEFPARITGPVRLQGNLRIAKEYLWSSSTRTRYFSDLNIMRWNGYADYRPMTGPVQLPYAYTSWSDRNDYSSNFGISLQDIPEVATSGWTYPSGLGTYRLYEGGATYSAVTLPSQISNATYAPDPWTNPLGIFVRNGTLTIGNNVTIRGTLIVTEDLYLDGTFITLESPSQPALDGTMAAVHLPTVIVADDFHVRNNAEATVRGVAAVFDRFEVERGGVATRFWLNGCLITAEFKVDERQEWDLSGTTWSMYQLLFNLSNAQYLPVWLSSVLSPVSRIIFAPPIEPMQKVYHWMASGNPLYTPPPNSGLRWDVVRWPR